MKDTNYITIQGWMINRLKLKGNQLIVFAIIYGFSQDGESEFNGSLAYICKSINATRPTAAKALKELVEMDLLVKYTDDKNGVKFNSYVVSLEGVKKLYYPSKENSTEPGKETLHNNTSSNNSRRKVHAKPEFNENLLGEKIPTGNHLFKNSPFYELAIFEKKLNKESEMGIDIVYYWNACDIWSRGKGAKRMDWVAVARGMMQRDQAEKKLQMKVEYRADNDQAAMDFLNLKTG